MKNDEQQQLETYVLANTWKRIVARVLDIIFASVIPFVMGLIMHVSDKNDEWWQLILLTFVNLIIVIIYFIIVPWKWNGQTVGKWILQIKLRTITNDNLRLKQYFYRELYLVLIPLVLTTSTILVVALVFHENLVSMKNNSTLNSWLNILLRAIVSFDFAWYCGIMIVIKIDKYHQLFYDRSTKAYVVNKKPLPQKIKKIINTNETTINLVPFQPGNIVDEELEKIDSL